MAFTKEELDELRPKYVNQVPVVAATSQPKPNTIPDRIQVTGLSPRSKPKGETPVMATPVTPQDKPAPAQPAQSQQAVQAAQQQPVQASQPQVTQTAAVQPQQTAADELAAVREQFGVQLPEETVIPEVNKNYWQKYGNYNWNANNGDFFKNAAEANLPLADAIRYYDAYQKDNGGQPLDPYSLYVLMGKYDPTESIKSQKEDDARLKRQQQWEKVGNVFNHLANLWGTTRGAAPMTLEDGTALTKRQQKQVDRVKALRSAAGKQYLDMLAAKRADEYKNNQLEIQRQKAAQQNEIQKQRLENAKEAIELKKQLADAKIAGDKAKEAEIQSKIDLNAARQRYLDIQTEYYPQKIANDTTRANASATSASASKQNANTKSKQASYKEDYDEVTTVEKDLMGTKQETVKRKVKRGTADDAAKQVAEKKAEDAKKAEAAKKAATKPKTGAAAPKKGKGKGKNGQIVIKGIV